MRVACATLLVAMVIIGCSNPTDPDAGKDLTPPPAIDALTVTRVTSSRVILEWTAPDADDVGYYRVYHSTCPLPDSSCGAAGGPKFLKAPSDAGERDTVVYVYLRPDTEYYFGVTTVDHSGNESALSNIATAITADQDRLEWLGTTSALTVNSGDFLEGPINSYLYLYTTAASYLGLSFYLIPVDVSDPSQPSNVHWRHGVPNPRVYSAFEGVVYIVGYPGDSYPVTGSQHLYAVIAPPAQPEIIGSVQLSDSLQLRTHYVDMAIHNGYAYLTSLDSTLTVVDVQDPRNLSLVTVHDGMPFDQAQLQLSNDLLIVNSIGKYSGSSVTAIIDISDPENVSEVGSYDALGAVKYIDVTDHTLYVGTYDREIQIVDISDPAVPIKKSVYTPDASYSHFAGSGDYLCIADSNLGIQLVSTANPASPVLVTTYDFPWKATVIHVQEGYVYVYDRLSYGCYKVHIMKLKNLPCPL